MGHAPMSPTQPRLRRARSNRWADRIPRHRAGAPCRTEGGAGRRDPSVVVAVLNPSYPRHCRRARSAAVACACTTGALRLCLATPRAERRGFPAPSAAPLRRRAWSREGPCEGRSWDHGSSTGGRLVARSRGRTRRFATHCWGYCRASRGVLSAPEAGTPPRAGEPAVPDLGPEHGAELLPEAMESPAHGRVWRSPRPRERALGARTACLVVTGVTSSGPRARSTARRGPRTRSARGRYRRGLARAPSRVGHPPRAGSD